MPRKLFLPLLVFLSFGLAAQIDGDHLAELPPGSVKIKEGEKDNAEIRFLLQFYQIINYPATARNAGISGAVQYILNIDTLGVPTVDTARFITTTELNDHPIKMAKNDVITVTAYGVSGGSSTQSSSATKNPKTIAKAQKALIAEVIRVVEDYPNFTPATREGKVVESKMVKLVLFRLE